ncbi:hypothetical protein CRYUN_Cryun24cG0069700 [Craigia yunnanensis]
MGSRNLSIGASLDSPDALFERNHTKNVSMVSLKFHESNGVLDQGHQASSPVRRDVVNRSLSAGKFLENDDMDLEGGKLEKDINKTIRSNKVVKIQNQALLSGVAYCISSCSMILVNKFVLSSYDFNAGISLMLYQNFISVVIVSILSSLGLISTEPLRWRLIKVWLPVNVIFVGMLVTSMFRPLLRMPDFWLVITLSGFLGMAISFTSMWFLHQTGATTYSLVGSLNKIPLSVAGIVLFKVPTSLENSASIFFGLLA